MADIDSPLGALLLMVLILACIVVILVVDAGYDMITSYLADILLGS